MDTEDRQMLRELAYTMQETYKDDPEGLKQVQEDARKAVRGLRESYKGEPDDVLAIIAYAGTAMASRLTFMPPRHLANALETMTSAYPLAAGALAGVYALPELEDRKGEAAKPAKEETGLYL